MTPEQWERRKVSLAAYRAANQGKIKASAAAYRKANADKLKASRVATAEQRKPYQKAYREVNADKAREYMRAYLGANEVELKAKQAVYYAENRQKYLDAKKKARAEQADLIKAKKAAWAKANSDWTRAYLRARKARSRLATPKWLTKEHKAQIRVIYREAIALGHHVDHIVPLNGKTVSGLHVPWNLQPLPPAENLSKGNRHA